MLNSNVVKKIWPLNNLHYERGKETRLNSLDIFQTLYICLYIVYICAELLYNLFIIYHKQLK